MKKTVATICIVLASAVGAVADPTPKMTMPPSSKLVFEEDWSTGRIDPDKWYVLQKRWGARSRQRLLTSV